MIGLLRFAPWLIAAAGIAAAAFLFWQNGRLHEANGKLELENKQLQSTLKEKADARKSRANTDGAVRRMPPADVIERLR